MLNVVRSAHGDPTIVIELIALKALIIFEICFVFKVYVFPTRNICVNLLSIYIIHVHYGRLFVSNKFQIHENFEMLRYMDLSLILRISVSSDLGVLFQ